MFVYKDQHGPHNKQSNIAWWQKLIRQQAPKTSPNPKPRTAKKALSAVLSRGRRIGKTSSHQDVLDRYMK